MSYISNIKQVLADDLYDLDRRFHDLTLSNDATNEHGQNYARFLQARRGYAVFSDQDALDAVAEALRALVRTRRPLTDARIAEALQAGGEREIERIQSVVGSKDTDGRYQNAPRDQHPGSWADDSNLLANSFAISVNGEAPKRVDYDKPALR